MKGMRQGTEAPRPRGAAGLPGRQSGAGVLPVVVAVAVIAAVIEVPILYKSNAGNRMSGSQRTHILAKNLAEAAVDQITTDIGQKKYPVAPGSDTTPYSGVTLGKGTYTGRVQGTTSPDTIFIRTSGLVGTDQQMVTAKMKVVRSLTDIPFATPKYSTWGVSGTPPHLYYYSLDEKSRGISWVHDEGPLDLGADTVFSIDDFTVAPNGTMYFLNNNNVSGVSKVYKIRPNDLDNKPTTEVPCRYLGRTGLLSAGTTNNITGLTFIADRDSSGHNGVLFGCTYQTKKIYELSIQTGAASPVCSLTVGGTFQMDAITQGLDGQIYIARTNGSGSELWQITDWISGSATKICNINSGASAPKVRALAGHPDGYIYATDDNSWYKIDPSAGTVTTLFAYNSLLKGIGFHFEREHNLFNGTPIPGKKYVCHIPPGNPANAHTLSVGASAVPAHLGHGDYEGYCGFPFVNLITVVDTTIQLKVLSWQESSAVAPAQVAAGH